jgi:ribonuclease E
MSRNERIAEKNPRDETSAGGERQERRPRAERKERAPRQQPDAVDNRSVQPAAVVGVAASSLPPDTNAARDGAGTMEEQASRRRGRRGGRGRGERRNEPDGAVASGIQGTTPDVISTPGEEPVLVLIPPIESKTLVVAETPAVQAPVEALPVVSEPAPLAIEPVRAAVEPVPVSLTGEIPVPEAVAVDIAAVDIAKTSETTPLPAPADASPTVTLEKALIESGLVLVQTTVPAAVVPDEPEPRLGRPRKQQAHAAKAEEGPLVMVETAK